MCRHLRQWQPDLHQQPVGRVRYPAAQATQSGRDDSRLPYEAESQTVDLDAQAAALGLAQGEIYPMHIFFAERHVTMSDFVVETTLSEIGVCD